MKSITKVHSDPPRGERLAGLEIVVIKTTRTAWATMDESASAPPEPGERTTAPQSPYTIRQVWVGLLVTAVGVAIVFGIPIVATI